MESSIIGYRYLFLFCLYSGTPLCLSWCRRNERSLSNLLYRWNWIPPICQCVSSGFFSNGDSHIVGQAIGAVFTDSIQCKDLPKASLDFALSSVVFNKSLGGHMVHKYHNLSDI